MHLIPKTPSRRFTAFPSFSFVLALAAAATAASAGTVTPTLPGDSTRAQGNAPTLEDLDQKIRILERELEVKEEDEQAKAAQTAGVTAGADGFSIQSADKESSLKIKLFTQTDGRYFFDDGANKLANTLLLRRVRPSWEGTVGKYYSFRVVPEFAGGFQILDAYSEIAYWPEARLRIGKSKTPIGLERFQSSQDIDIIEFAHPTSLTPNYDLGISLLGDFLGESISYYAGVFNGAVDGTSRDVDLNDDKDLAGRVFALPFKNAGPEVLRNFGVGFAASWGHKEGDAVNTEAPAYKTEGQQTFFSYRSVADKASAVTYNATTKAVGTSAAVVGDTGTVRAFGDGYRLNPQGYWYAGPFGLFGEWIASAQEVQKGGAGNTSLLTTAWQATASYVVTGESPGFKGIKPRHAVSFAEPGGFGALELVARVSHLDVDANAFPFYADPAKSAREATTWTGGVNWYLSRYVKWSADYEWTAFKGGAAGGGDRPEEKVFFSRLQTVF